MKKIFVLVLACLMLFVSFSSAYADKLYYYDNAWHKYSGNTFSLKVNGKLLSPEMPPIVFDDYSVVPARDVFSELGALVEWKGETQQIFVSTDSLTITLKINSKKALVGKNEVTMPISPKLINGKTMIPVRFVGENLGYEVTFDSSSDTVCIDDKKEITDTGVNVTDFDYDEKKNSIILTLKTSGEDPEYNDFILENPQRLVVDVKGGGFVTLPKDINVSRGSLKTIRFGNYNAARVVFDMEKKLPYDVKAVRDEVIIAITLSGEISVQTAAPIENPPVSETENPSDVSSPKPTEEPKKPLDLISVKSTGGYDSVVTSLKIGTAKKLTNPARVEFEVSGENLPEESDKTTVSGNFVKELSYTAISPQKAKIVLIIKDEAFRVVQSGGNLTVRTEKSQGVRSVMIDAGHGGGDAGAVGYDENGKEEAYEKDFNLDVALKIRDILKQKNIDVKMIRQTDTYVDFRQVGAIANDAEVDLFVSIHTNSAVATSAHGIETWAYLEENATTVNGMSGKRLAEIIQNELIYETGAYDRGIKNGKSLAVINSTSMPAVLVEMGFISNTEERHNLMTDSYRSKIAHAVAAGIIAAFDEMGI